MRVCEAVYKVIIMKEIRWHGRGGQGAVTAAEVLAVAAFEDGKYSQAFPHFGVERRGAPVQAFTRIDDKFIRLREHVYTPDYVIVLEPTLLDAVNVAEGLKKGGIIIINTEMSPKEVKEKLGVDNEVRCVDATKIALEEIGKPFVNMPMLGAFVKATGLVSLDSVKKAITERFKHKKGLVEKNIKAVERSYEELR